MLQKTVPPAIREITRVKKQAILFLLASGIVFAPPAGAADEKIYPGAKAEEIVAPAGMGMPPGSRIRYYLTDAPFEKVASYYQGLYTEVAMPNEMAPTLPDGKKVRSVFFSLDGKKDITAAEHVLKVQRPFIGDIKTEGGSLRYTDVRDVTVIQFIDYR